MNEAARLLRRAAGAPARRTPYWLIFERRRGRLEVLTTRLADDRKVLPVFSFEEEAVLYARLGTRIGWRARSTSAGELLSILYGPCREVELVALDPWPDSESDVASGLISLGRKRFVDHLLLRSSPARPFPSIAPSTGPALDAGSRPKRALGFREKRPHGVTLSGRG